MRPLLKRDPRKKNKLGEFSSLCCGPATLDGAGNRVGAGRGGLPRARYPKSRTDLSGNSVSVRPYDPLAAEYAHRREKSSQEQARYSVSIFTI
jgi:hypothetical protein